MLIVARRNLALGAGLRRRACAAAAIEPYETGMTNPPENSQDGQEPTPGAGLVMPARRSPVMARLRNYLLTGILVTAPIGITIYLAWAFIDFVDTTVTPLIPAQYQPERYLKFSVPGLGILIVAVALVLIGFLTANYLGRTLIQLGERLVDRMPVVRTVYSALKQILETIIKQSSNAFRQCVLVEYPRKGLWVVAFVTAETSGEIRRLLDQELISVFVPTTPNPTSGFIIFVPKADLIYLDMTIEEGMKLVVSAGMVSPLDRGAPGYSPPESENDAWRRRQEQLLRAVREK